MAVTALLSAMSSLFFLLLILPLSYALTGSVYTLDTEYAGANFFAGFDFFTDPDPTAGFVTYYNRRSAELTGLVNTSGTGPTYVGVDYTNAMAGLTGRPSVRVTSKRFWTHGLFIGDFAHMPGGICGTWPAFWTLGPNWPYTGEIDIMEGVNQLSNNAVSLHTNTTCTIAGDPTTQTGQLSNSDCAYYPGYNVGCGVVDNRTTSYGTNFNQIGGGVYAMQWTSEYIRVWFFPRNAIPQDISNLTPNPSAWGLPAANMQGNCQIDGHFQQHRIILDNTFCGQYAGDPTMWNSTTNSCAALTGFANCVSYVAATPAAFQNAYWSINSIRVYQLQDNTTTTAPYIASLQSTSSRSSTISSSTPIPTTSLCPTYNFTVVTSGNLNYEIECGVNPGGPDLGKPSPSYQVNSFEDCVAGCTAWNSMGYGICVAVTYKVSSNACYWKGRVNSIPADPAYNGARLIFYGYPAMTDNPNYPTPSPSSFVATQVTPNYYRNLAVSYASTSLMTASAISTLSGGGMGGTVTANYSLANTISTATASQSTGTTTFSGSSSSSAPSLTVANPGTTSASYPPTSPTALSVSSLSPTTAASSVSSRIAGIFTNLSIATTSVTSASSSLSIPTTFMPSSASGSIYLSSTIVLPASATVQISFSISSANVESSGTQATSSSTSSASILPSSNTYTTTPSSTSQASSPNPTTINQFTYAGCQGSANAYAGFNIVEDSDSMTLDQCISDCYVSRYAGIYSTSCYCSDDAHIIDDFIRYGDAQCDIPCPGNPAEICGGYIDSDGMRLAAHLLDKRQNMDSIVLLTLYNNTLAWTTTSDDSNALGTSLGSSLSTTVMLPATSMSSPSSISLVAAVTTTSETTSPTATNAPASSSPDTATAVQTSIGPSPATLSGVIINTFVMTTKYVDICTSCPRPTPTTSTTTITIFQQYCHQCAQNENNVFHPETANDGQNNSPTIPMTTTVRSCACGGGSGALDDSNEDELTPLTVTIPCVEAIQSANNVALAGITPAPTPSQITGQMANTPIFDPGETNSEQNELTCPTISTLTITKNTASAQILIESRTGAPFDYSSSILSGAGNLNTAGPTASLPGVPESNRSANAVPTAHFTGAAPEQSMISGMTLLLVLDLVLISTALSGVI